MSRRDKIFNQIKSNLDAAVNLLEDIDPNLNKSTTNGNDDRFKIIHLHDNPMELAVQKRKEEYERLKKENEKLKMRLNLLESGDADVTRQIDVAGDKSNQIELLRRRVEALKEREDKLLTSYSRMGREFREVFYLLTGLRIHAMKDDIYEVSNMYAENENDKLLLQLARDGTTQLLQNEYSDKLTDYIETYLEKYDSFPAFLAALTLNLFKSDDIDMSVDMLETTVVPKF